ncbi:unnamed protein product [Schistosoma curassoni]|uniref:mRNA cap guanine-N(7) methyltransferase n=1 Tax=Schistosoma curassoni TaxID=6186 RepID=A0A183K214_9TREM|nr:unnamed protein product [Schistosoma curassoni]VDP33725.1 unnamed protein product [Schistosoma curassoni]
MAEISNRKDVISFYDAAARNDENNSHIKRRETRIFYLRNFNNWMKSVFISKSLQSLDVPSNRARILDLCCGKGGDQLKWLRGGVQHVTFVDLSNESIEVCRHRYEQLCRNKRSVFTADFFVADCSEAILPQVLPSGVLYDLVSCQFALHYAFESIAQARRILSNISSLLQENGFFIATIPNAYELLRRATEALNKHVQKQVSESDIEEIKFGNPVYSVTFPKASFSISRITTQTKDAVELTFPLFGAKYNFFLDGVVNCPEFVVYPPLLDRLAADYGLVPVHEPISFANNFYSTLRSRSSPQDPKDLLKRMEALEPWHKSNNYPCSNDDEYIHLIDHQNSLRNNSCSYGTLSKSDWEVTSMYSLLAYQKKTNKV